MTFVNPTTAGAAGVTTATTTSASTNQSSSGLNQLDNSQTFLKLLVAQLKNQNPDNPTNPTSFMTEIAQMTAVQSQTTLNAEEQTVAADSMIGRAVNGTGTDGKQVSGTVAGVLLTSSGAPQLQLSTGAAGSAPTTTLPLDAVTRVYTATTTATTPSSTTSAGSSTAA